MSAEKKARVVLTTKRTEVPVPSKFLDLDRLSSDVLGCVLHFVCIIDLLSLRRCARFTKKRVDAYQKTGAPMRHFTALFYRETGLTEEFMTRLREGGGFFTGPQLAQLVARPQAANSWTPELPHSPDFVLPADSFAGDKRDVKLHPMLDSRVQDWKFVLANQKAIHSRYQIHPTMAQVSIDFNPTCGKYEVDWIVTGTYDATKYPTWTRRFSYTSVEFDPLQFVYEHSATKWEQCVFDGKKLEIFQVQAFLDRSSPYLQKSYRWINVDRLSHIGRMERLDQRYWTLLGYTFPPLTKQPPGYRFKRTLTRPMQNRSRTSHSVADIVKDE